ncbi:MAG: bifunctional precorrin-2 dehydrogenase/sirohydrochlorin ferrochelatase [Chloroflexota bacterium]
MKTYPICLIGLEGRQAVVVGGGSVAARKVKGLLEAGAKVTVVSPVISADLQALVAPQTDVILGLDEELPAPVIIERSYRSGDLEGAFLVIAATDDPAVNEAVWQEASRRGCLVNVVDDPLHSNFIVPAIVRRGELLLAISTGGASPALARRLRQQLEAQFGPEYGQLVELMASLRPELMQRFSPGAARLEAALRLVDSDLLQVIRDRGVLAARLYAQDLLSDNLEAEL